MAREITWIEKPGGSQNPHTHIISVGGAGWGDTAEHVINAIRSSLESYYVFHQGRSVWVEVGHRGVTPYLRTQSDGTPLDNLLSLVNVSA